MKIICDSCGTKYSISDDKVRGKVFKIRCKKCSHIIVVRGGETAAEEAAPVAEGGWHIVVDGEQVGPISEAEIRARIERGEIRGDTYTWKEGFADWLKLSSIPEFSGLVGEAVAGGGGDLFPAGDVAAAGTNGTERSRRPTGGRSPLFGGGGGGGGAATEDVFAAPARNGSGDLFAAASASVSDEPRWPTSGAVSAGHDGGRVENLTAQRHENSVLFSLSNLQSLAIPSTTTKPSGGTTSATPDGSGLIDIRAMAASSLSTESRGSSGGGGDDLPSFGSFAPAAPVLLPLSSSSGAPKWIYPVILLMIGLVAVIGIMAWKVMSAKSPLEPERVIVQVPAPAPEPTKAAKPAEDTKPSTVPDDKLPPREGEDKADKKAEAKADSKADSKSDGKPDKGDHHRSSRRERDKKGASASDEKKAAAAAPVAAVDTGPKPAKGSIDDLLAGATRTGGRSSAEERKAAAAESSAGPLAKNAVVAGMNSVKPKIADCYNQFKVPGMAMVTVVIGKNGKVASATVTGKFAGTPTGVCVEKAVKTAAFPPSDGLTTPYPFQLR